MGDAILTKGNNGYLICDLCSGQEFHLVRALGTWSIQCEGCEEMYPILLRQTSEGELMWY